MTEPTEFVLEAEHLRRTYERRLAVVDFSATVAPGEVVVLVGPNGCGKTTSVEMAIGLRRSEAGFSRIAGHDVVTQRREVARVLGLQLQGAELHSRVRLREQLEYLAALHGVDESSAGEVPRLLGLEGIVDRVYGSLSGGMQRRALVALAFVGHPRLVVLDEPTSGVDIESRNEIWAALNSLLVARGAGVLVTTHDLSEAQRHADRVIVMRQGEIIASGPPAQLIAAAQLALVLTIRDRRGGAVPALPATAPGSVTVLRTSASEATLGFASRAAAQAYRAQTQDASGSLDVVEQSPTFEDAYLAIAARHDATADRSGPA